MSYKCSICRRVVPPGVAMMRHVVRRANGEIAREYPACADCVTELQKGVPLNDLLVRFRPRFRPIVVPPPETRTSVGPPVTIQNVGKAQLQPVSERTGKFLTDSAHERLTAPSAPPLPKGPLVLGARVVTKHVPLTWADRVRVGIRAVLDGTPVGRAGGIDMANRSGTKRNRKIVFRRTAGGYRFAGNAAIPLEDAVEYVVKLLDDRTDQS